MPWAPGLPGMAALGSTTAAGLALSLASYVWNLLPTQPMGKPHAQMQSFALTTGMVAVYFWLWAVLNSARSHFDLGCVSFLFPMACSAWLLVHTPSSSQVRVLRFQRLGAGLAPLLPAANYALAVGIASGKLDAAPTLVAYFVMGTTWWLLASVIGACTVSRQIRWLLGRRLRDPDAISDAQYSHRDGSSSPT